MFNQNQLFLLALLAFLASAESWPIRRNAYTLSGTSILSIENVHVNLKTQATITISHKLDIHLCLQEGFAVSPDPTWWNQSCTRYYTFKGDGSGEPDTKAAFLRNVRYNLAVALWDIDGTGLDGKSDTIDFSLGLSVDDDTCPDGKVYDDKKATCLDPSETTINTWVNTTFDADERKFYYFDVPARANSIRLTNNPSMPAQLVFQIRRMGTPGLLDQLHDGSIGARATFDYPRPGRYYLVARAASAGAASFTITVSICGNNSMVNGTLGPNCDISYSSKLIANMSKVSHVGVWEYYQVQCSPQTPISVMVRSWDGTFLPRIYASKDQLPLADGNSDLPNCHAAACSGVNTMNITCSVNEVWYIGVTSSGTQGAKYGIWFEPVCAPGCDAHGTCSYSYPNIGECVCNAQYLGPDCALESDVNARFIVLCVIAVLLVVSALLGLIVQKVQLWRRSKTTYQQL